VTIEKDKIYPEIDLIVSEIGTTESSVIPILHAIQKKFNYLPEIALRRVCETTDITPASITGVSTFYTQFRHSPAGNHLIYICSGTACHVKGSELVYDALSRELNRGRSRYRSGRFIYITTGGMPWMLHACTSCANR